MRILYLSVVAICALGARAEATYGICSHISRTEFDVRWRNFEAIRDLGLSSIRMDCDWRSFEKSPGEWDFSRFDTIVADAATCGLTILPILYSPPNGVRVWEDARWGDFCRRVAERYRGRIPAMEIWNEQNAASFWGGVPDATNYCIALKAAYRAIKSASPETTVAIGGFAGVPLDFIEGVYAAGGKEFFDVMSVHPYDERRTPERALEKRLMDLRAVMERHGDGGKAIWLTEVGWDSSPTPFAAPGLMARGVNLARPGGERLDALYTDFWFTECARVDDRPFFGAIADALPSNVVLRHCRPCDLARTLASSPPDILVLPPFDERYPGGTLDAICAFVNGGGTLVDFGGAPLFRESKVDEQDLGDEIEHSWTAARRLRIGVRADARGCFFDRSRLKAGDTFVPLDITPLSNGTERVNAALYKFAEGGNVLVSGIREKNRCVPISEKAQAKYLARTLLIARAAGASSIWWYNLRARDYDWHAACYGLAHSDYTRKPAYDAMKAFVARCPPSARMRDGTLRTGRDYHPQWTMPDGTEAGALWSIAAAREVVVAFSAENVTLSDHMGTPVPPSSAASSGTRRVLTLTDSPVYFSGGRLVGIEAR